MRGLMHMLSPEGSGNRKLLHAMGPLLVTLGARRGRAVLHTIAPVALRPVALRLC
jgi:hypothetical protein